MKPSLESLEVFYGELTPNRAVVHARVMGGAESADLSLDGTVRGPRSSRGHTLPTTYRLVGQASRLPGQVENPSYVSAQALVTEPIFWSPDWPALYDVTVELRRGSEIIAQAARSIGLRPVAVAGKNLSYGGKTWVLRGVRRDTPLGEAINQCREQAAALVAPAELLDERLLTQASEAGVLTVAIIADRNSAAEKLSQLSGFAAVAIAVLPRGNEPFRPASRTNILLAHRLEQGEDEPPPDDTRLVLGEVTEAATFADWARALSRTVIAYRKLGDRVDVAAARGECDRLQRDLAPYGQFAGYVV